MKYVVVIIAMLMSTQFAAAQTLMTNKELLVTIPGKTLNGLSNIDNKTQWTKTFSARKGRSKKGKILGYYSGKKHESNWKVKNDQWCEYWRSGKWKCFSLERVGAKEFRIYKDGKPLKNFWTLK
jgi:hypothetical protein